MPGGVDFELTPHGKEIIQDVVHMGEHFQAAIEKAMRKSTVFTIRESLKSFDDQAQPGGKAWPTNVGPYDEFKKTIVGQMKANFLHGDLRMSISELDNREPQIEHVSDGLRVSVGTTIPYGGDVFDGTTGIREFTVDWGGKTYFFQVNGTPPRPFLPTEAHVIPFMDQVFGFEIDKAWKEGKNYA